MKLTDEQKAIVDYIPKQGDIITIEALAGTGKTFILTKIVEAIVAREPFAKILYLAYNKAIQTEAITRFNFASDNVECRTTHSMAYVKHGAPLRKKLRQNIRLTDLNYVVMPERRGISYNYKWPFLKAVKATCDNFMYSSDFTLTEKHICSDLLLEGLPDNALALVVPCAKELYIKGTNPDDKAPATHDMYLKEWQISKPKLQYSYILLDEAQDTNKTVLDIVKRQKSTIYYTGDPYQQLYSFRGSVDTFKKIKATASFSLTASFRFGSEIADNANKVLKLLKCPYTMTGVGKNVLPNDHKVTFIARSNAELFIKACSLIEKGIPFRYAAGIDKEALDLIRDIHYLYEDELGKIKSNFLKQFRDFGMFIAYVMDVADVEGLRLLKLQKKYGDALLQKVNQVEHKMASTIQARVLLTTAHKAKGLEYHSVVIADDFTRTLGEGLNAVKFMDKETARTLYVAITRSTDSFVYMPDILEVLAGDVKVMSFDEALKKSKANQAISKNELKKMDKEWARGDLALSLIEDQESIRNSSGIQKELQQINNDLLKELGGLI